MLGLSCVGGWLRQRYWWPCQLAVLLLRVPGCESALLPLTCAVLQQSVCVWHHQRCLLLP
jgi:hypothetical protein